MINGFATSPYLYGAAPGQMIPPADYGFNQPMQNVQPMPQQNQQPKAQQIVDGGFATVQSIEEAKSYPVSRGTIMTLKIENSPYICTKLMGFSMFEQPIFKKFLLKEVNDDDEIVEPVPVNYVTKEDHEKVIEQLTQLSEEIKKLKEKAVARKRTKVRDDDEYDE